VVTNCGAAAIAPLGAVNGASYSAASLASSSFATIFGSGLSGETAQAGPPPYPVNLAVLEDGSSVSLPPYQCSEVGCSAVAVPVPPTATDLYIVLYGTGIRDYSSISATLGTSKPEVAYAGSVGQFPGLDQVNLHLKPPFHLGGTQALQLQAVTQAITRMFGAGRGSTGTEHYGAALRTSARSCRYCWWRRFR